ncbi:hypothetical protein ACFWFB_33505 [Streptomyces albidoflavus]
MLAPCHRSGKGASHGETDAELDRRARPVLVVATRRQLRSEELFVADNHQG